MIVPDVNLIIYAHDSESPMHRKAAAWWGSCLSGREPIGLAAVVVFAFIRLATSPRLFERPLTLEKCSLLVSAWLSAPPTVFIPTDRRDIDVALALMEVAGAAGNLTTDAQIGALAVRHRALVHTADTDFSRLPGVRWRNPIRNA